MPSMKDALLSAYSAAGHTLPGRAPSTNGVGSDVALPKDGAKGVGIESSTVHHSSPAPKHDSRLEQRFVTGKGGREIPVVNGPSSTRSPANRPRQRSKGIKAKGRSATAPMPSHAKFVVQREAPNSSTSCTVAPPPIASSPPQPAIQLAPGAKCLVAYYPDAPRAAADYGNVMGTQVQLATAQSDDVHDVTIGLDFGTSTVKVVVTDASLEQSFAVPLCTGGAFDRYLLPSRVFERSVGMGDELSEIAFSLRDGGVVHRDLKLGLLGHPNSQVHQVRVVAFLGLVMRTVRAWLFQEHASVYRRARIAWRVAIGLPAATVLNNALVPLLQNLVGTAWRIAGEQTEVTSRGIQIALNESLSPEEIDLEVNVLPEIAAQIYGFVVSQRFDRKAVNRFVMVDVGAGTIDSALFRVLPPKQGMWSFEFVTAVVQPFGVANLHAHRVSWWERLLSKHSQFDHLLHQLVDTKFATDIELAPPATYRDYFEGVSINKMASLPSPDEDFFQKQVMTQVRGQTMWRAWKDSLLPREALTGVPIFVCGGGSRMSFYSRINDEIGRMPGFSWLSAEPWSLGFPEDLYCESTDEAHFDRLSVAYGLSRLNLGSVVQAPPIPTIEVPQQSWTDRYIDKDAC